MKVTVVFYGGLKECSGTKKQTLDLAVNAVTILELVEHLTTHYPTLTPHLATVAYVVAHEIVGDDYVLRDGDEVALLPPVSGG